MTIIDRHEYLCKEEQRLKEDKERQRYWKKWGPYTAERQWATGLSSPLWLRVDVLISLQSAKITRKFPLQLTPGSVADLIKT